MADQIWGPPPNGADVLDHAPMEITVEAFGDGDDLPGVNADGTITIPTEDGGVIVDLNPERPAKDTNFDDNLALEMQDSELGAIAENLLTGIQADDESRNEWLGTRNQAIDLLGLKLEPPRGDVGGSNAAPMEGMATVRHPVLLEAVLKSQATAAGELLPAAGPVKTEILGEATAQKEALSEALESDLNDYLTNQAPEYYPDTRRALFWSSFGGSAFKKVFTCPIRQRPVSESVDAKDIIVSAHATDLANAVRVTHVIMMRQSIMKRMQVDGIYRDVHLAQPSGTDSTEVDRKLETVEGIRSRNDRPEDQPYKVYECYCELDLPEFAPKQFRGKSIPLPYRVTLEKDSRQVLEIRRFWEEDDPRCLARRCLVKYPYIEAIGIYGIGLLHILGNSDSALTAAWRLMLDNGMFANFPGGIVDKAASRQLTNEFRIPPGGMVQLDFGGRNASQVYGQLPYRDLGPVFVQFISNMQEVVQRLAGAAEMPVGEGRQDIPVGTMLAMIEQATKINSEVHKGLHSAQAEEFQLLKERFKDDPSALWRNNHKSKLLELWSKDPKGSAISQTQEAEEEHRRQMFIAALNDVNIVPVADPNTPSHVHRMLKLSGLKQTQMGNPNIDQDTVDRMVIRGLGFDPSDLFKPEQPPGPPPPDAKLITAQAAQDTAQARLMDAQTKAKTADIDAQIAAAKIAGEQRVAELQVQREVIIHQNDMALAEKKLQSEMVRAHVQQQSDDMHQHLDRAVQDRQAHLDRASQDQHAHLDRAADMHQHYAGLAHKSELDRLAGERAAEAARVAAAAKANGAKSS